MDLDNLPDEWWWYVANDDRGQPNLWVALRPLSYRFRWTRLRMPHQTQHNIEAILNAVYHTTHHYACRRLNLRFSDNRIQLPMTELSWRC
jgi:hypothetical protein